jgi:aspartyl-tRNA(Asn)/glutamyl-tRNA(Gln) amidotransferase subunit A
MRRSLRVDELLSRPAYAIAGAIRRREACCVEITRAALRAIDRWQPAINCFIRVAAKAALAAAARADADRHRGLNRGPLHGVPMAYKDRFFRDGGPSTFGSGICRDFVGTATAAVLERLEAAGAIPLGGLNMGEFAISPTGHNDHYGHCRNPWNPARITGGSSSGSAAAVAARLVAFALGSDTGGSVRLPAALCGVAGLKPTHGLVSRHGSMPRAWSLDVIGPLARSVADCALVLDAIAGPDDRDATTLRQPRRGYAIPFDAQDLSGVRVGTPRADAFWSVDDEATRARGEPPPARGNRRSHRRAAAARRAPLLRTGQRHQQGRRGRCPRAMDADPAPGILARRRRAPRCRPRRARHALRRGAAPARAPGARVRARGVFQR